MDFETLRKAVHTKKPNLTWAQSILALDPGHTTGWAFFQYGGLQYAGEIGTHSIEECIETASPIFHRYRPRIVVMEDYRVYKWRQKHHVGSELLTTQVMGCLQTLAIQDFCTGTEIIKQPAHIAKGFCTDKKLKEWDYWMLTRGNRHARDAIRHGCYFILFGAIRAEDKQGGISVG